ncbi:MAG: DUF58 domain-containing protein [Anaerolineae bacterium]|nr:DUF58 domain-containing protein [Anaerolineae bacterium]
MKSRRYVFYFLTATMFVVGIFTGKAYFFNVGYMLLGVIIISYVWSWFSVRWISITRKTRARRAQVGRTFEETFIVKNRSIIPKLWVEVEDQSDLPDHRASRVVPSLGISGQHDWSLQTRCIARGEFRLGPMVLMSGDPFGLFTARRFINATSRVVIYPTMVKLSHVDLPMGMLSGGEAQRQRSHYVTTNAAGVRDYVMGDSINRVHWRTTARRDQLTVKEFEIDPLVDIWMFADFARTSVIESPDLKRSESGYIIPTHGGIPASTEEYVAVVTASLARYFIDLERVLGFIAYTPQRALHQPERGRRQLTHILETLAVAKSTNTYTLAQTLVLEAQSFSRGTTLIIVTSSADNTWITEAMLLSKRGIKVLCVLIDASTFGYAPSGEEMAAYLRVVKIPTLVIRRGDDIADALARQSL